MRVDKIALVALVAAILVAAPVSVAAQDGEAEEPESRLGWTEEEWQEWGEKWAELGEKWGRFGEEMGETWGRFGEEEWAVRGEEWGEYWSEFGEKWAEEWNAELGEEWADRWAAFGEELARGVAELDWESFSIAMEESLRVLEETLDRLLEEQNRDDSS